MFSDCDLKVFLEYFETIKKPYPEETKEGIERIVSTLEDCFKSLMRVKEVRKTKATRQQDYDAYSDY